MRMRFAAFLLASAATLASAMLPSATSAQTAPAASTPAPPARGNGAQQDFTIVNNTGHTIMSLNVSPSEERTWGPNILGGDKLGNGESAQITFPRGETQCNWDIKVTYDDGDVTDERKVNLCEVATVTLTPH